MLLMFLQTEAMHACKPQPCMSPKGSSTLTCYRLVHIFLTFVYRSSNTYIITSHLLCLPHVLPNADGCIPALTGQLRRVNDTVFASSLFTVPILNFTEGQNYKNSSAGFPMCYQVSGQSNRYFNLISDDCVSVNAHYALALDPSRQVIKAIGVVATDSKNTCHYIQVEVNDAGSCVAQVDGQALIANGTEFTGVSVHHKHSLVRIIVPNCSPPKQRLVMWIHCHKLLVSNMQQNLISFIINRGLQQRPTAHGLIGEFY